MFNQAACTVRRCSMRGWLVCLSLLAMMTTPLLAQEAGFGTIAGTVTDPNNAVVTGAAVTVLQTDTGIRRNLQTTSSGAYSATFLKPGTMRSLSRHRDLPRLTARG